MSGAARRVAAGAFSDTPWFVEFAKMGATLWLLHCLFLTFDGGVSTIFQRLRGDMGASGDSDTGWGGSGDACRVHRRLGSKLAGW